MTRRRVEQGRAIALGAFALASTTLAFALARRGRQYSFEGKVVVITGGARGFGLALARELARARPHLVLVSRTEHELAAAKIDLEARGAIVDTIVCDIRQRHEVEQAIETIARQCGRIDVLVNNAGIIQAMPFELSRVEDFEDSLDTHFRGPLYLIRAALPHMRRGSRIVNISSVGGRVAVPHLMPYCVGKFALAALSDALHAELAKDGIVVTTVAPWLMRTGSHRNVLVRGQHEQEARWFALGTALAAEKAERFAKQVVNACRRGRARLTPGWPANLAILADALFPELNAAIMSAVTRWVLPSADRPGADGRGRYSRDLDLGWLATIFPSRAAQRLNQPAAIGETK